MAAWEGTRPLLVEIQALVSQSYGQYPRKIAQGLDQSRLTMLLAVLQRHGNVTVHDQDVFINVTGGMQISETASDLAVLLSVVSSLRNKPLPPDLMAFGEIGLAGEIRPVQSGQERLREAVRQGFKTVLVPFANLPKSTTSKDINVVGVKNLREALEFVQNA
jgi:DNA repair protein RadA/Sms